MSEPFRPYEKLVEISVFGKKFQVPERNSLLRCFQFISPETIPYGRFCWNQDCQYCRVVGKLVDDDQSHELLSCKFLVSAGIAAVRAPMSAKPGAVRRPPVPPMKSRVPPGRTLPGASRATSSGSQRWDSTSRRAFARSSSASGA